MPENQWSPEEARAHASAGGRARAARIRARKAMSAPERARLALSDATGQAASALVDAAAGRNGFEELGPEDRLKAALKILEFGLGRPAQGPKPDEKPEQEQPGLNME